jgi:hypothetical protein
MKGVIGAALAGPQGGGGSSSGGTSLTEEELKRRMQEGTMFQMKAGGKVSSASKRADGCAIKGKTRGKMV